MGVWHFVSVTKKQLSAKVLSATKKRKVVIRSLNVINNSFGHFDFEFSWLWGITALFGRAEKEDDISIKILGLEG